MGLKGEAKVGVKELEHAARYVTHILVHFGAEPTLLPPRAITPRKAAKATHPPLPAGGQPIPLCHLFPKPKSRSGNRRRLYPEHTNFLLRVTHPKRVSARSAPFPRQHDLAIGLRPAEAVELEAGTVVLRQVPRGDVTLRATSQPL